MRKSWGNIWYDYNFTYCYTTFFLFLLVMQKGLKENFADVQVSVVDCPDLTKEPFAFPVKGKWFLKFVFNFHS